MIKVNYIDGYYKLQFDFEKDFFDFGEKAFDKHCSHFVLLKGNEIKRMFKRVGTTYLGKELTSVELVKKV